MKIIKNPLLWSGTKIQVSSYCDSDSTLERTFCIGYVSGVADSFAPVICAPGGPGGVTQGQFGNIVRKYLSDNPASLHLDADVLVLTILKQSFPCPKK